MDPLVDIHPPELLKYRLTSNLGKGARQFRIQINLKEFRRRLATLLIRTVDTCLAF
jgi:hypothetical protein